MATIPERIAIVETKVDSLKEHLEASRTDIIQQIDLMKETNTKEHAVVMAKLDDLTRFKDKWVWVGGGVLTILSLVFGHLETIIKYFH